MEKNWIENLPQTKGKLKLNAPLANTSWFKVGGFADVLFKPEDKDDLANFLKHLPANIPVTVLGATSNVIIRDKGIRGIVIKLGRGFNEITFDGKTIETGAASLDLNVALFARDNLCSGLEFLSGIPGTIGGGLRMNAGAYGREFKDILVSCEIVTRQGMIKNLSVNEMGFSYRHSNISSDSIFTKAILKPLGQDSKEAIQERIHTIRKQRESTQPITEKTGGSTFANPTIEECQTAGVPLMKSWELIQGCGADLIRIGDAQMSDKHRNFMINHGKATATDLENLGETIRQKVQEKYGILLRWEIKRLGEK